MVFKGNAASSKTNIIMLEITSNPAISEDKILIFPYYWNEIPIHDWLQFMIECRVKNPAPMLHIWLFILDLQPYISTYKHTYQPTTILSTIEIINIKLLLFV